MPPITKYILLERCMNYKPVNHHDDHEEEGQDHYHGHDHVQGWDLDNLKDVDDDNDDDGFEFVEHVLSHFKFIAIKTNGKCTSKVNKNTTPAKLCILLKIFPWSI